MPADRIVKERDGVPHNFGPIEKPRQLNRKLHSVQGLMETGLFIEYADLAYIGTKSGVKKMECKGR